MVLYILIFVRFDSKLENKRFCKSFPKCANYVIESQLNLRPIHLTF